MSAISLKQGLRKSIFGISILFLGLLSASLFYIKTHAPVGYPDLFLHLSNRYFNSPAIILLMSALSLIVAIVFIVLLINKHEISEKMNFFPVFLYTLWAGLHLQTFVLPKMLLINVLLLFALYQLLNTYRNENALSDLFLAAFCISISLFLSISCLIYIPLFFASLFILKPLNVRDFFVALIGFLCPVFIYECMAYLAGFEQWYIFNAVTNYFSYLHIPLFHTFEWVNIGLLFLLLLLSALAVIFQPHAAKVKTTKAKTVCWWWLFGALLVGLSSYTGGTVFLAGLLPSAVFITGDFLFYIKRPLFVNGFLALIFLSALSLVLFNLGLITL